MYYFNIQDTHILHVIDFPFCVLWSLFMLGNSTSECVIILFVLLQQY